MKNGRGGGKFFVGVAKMGEVVPYIMVTLNMIIHKVVSVSR